MDRAAAYDADVQRKARAAALKKSRRMNDRHVNIALQMQEKALKTLEATDPEEIDPKNLIAMLREATTLERKSRSAIIEEDRRTAAQEEMDETSDVVVYLPYNGRDKK